MYNEIKQNIIKNFLNKGYLYACGCKKEPIIDKIIENKIFETTYDYKNDIMTMVLGNGISIDFKFDWTQSTYSNHPNMIHYKIANIK